MTLDRLSRRKFLPTIGTLLLAGCQGPFGGTDGPTDGTPNENWRPPTDRPAEEVGHNVLVENLKIPWDVSVAANGDLFVSERVGRINRFTSGDLESVVSPDDAIDAEALPAGSSKRPWWVKGGEGGTLGVAGHPDYPETTTIYVYYTAAVEDGKVNRVSRFDVSAPDPSSTESILIPDIPAFKVHNGGRITFGPDGNLWVTTGTAAFDSRKGTKRAADPGSLAGKVLRVTPSGDPAPGNPDLGPDADPRVFTYGHRNPQGIVWVPDGATVINEHGGHGHDEINRLEAGADYGWPNSPRGKEKYTGTDGVHHPLANTGSNTWAPSGSVFYTGDAVPSWSNRMMIGALGSQQIVAATLTPPGGELPPVGETGRRFDADWFDDAYTVTAHPVMQNVLGRVRHLEQGLDGQLYAVTSNRDGRAKDPFPRPRDDVLVRLEKST